MMYVYVEACLYWSYGVRVRVHQFTANITSPWLNT